MKRGFCRWKVKTKFNINRWKVRTKCNISQTTIDHGHLYYISIIITRPRRGQMSRSSNLLDINLILLKHQHQNRSSDEPSGGPGEDSLAGLRVHGLPNISSSRCMENVYFWMMWTHKNISDRKIITLPKTKMNALQGGGEGGRGGY